MSEIEQIKPFNYKQLDATTASYLINTENPIRFRIDDILKVEGADKMSAYERKRLERRISELEREVKDLTDEKESTKKELVNVLAGLMPILQERSEHE